MFLGSRALPARKADNLTAIYEPISRQSVILDIPQSYRPPRPLTGIALLFVTVVIRYCPVIRRCMPVLEFLPASLNT
jgi:hypothetical protein